jgi:hypothetical protein
MSKRLYTEEDVRRLAPGSELVLGGAALATPAALDLAQARGVHVRFDRAAPTPMTDPSPWNAMLARDGSYLVHVAGGHPRIFRIEDTGPVPIPSMPTTEGSR